MLRHPKSCTSLYIWDKWCPSKNAQGFVKSIIHTEKGVLDFIAGCTLPPRTFYIRKFAPNARWEIDPETIDRFVALDDLEAIIKKIVAAPPENLDKRTEDALLTLVRFLDDEDYRKELDSRRRQGY